MQQKSFKEVLAESNRKYRPAPVENKTINTHLTLEELMTPQGRLMSDINYVRGLQ